MTEDHTLIQFGKLLIRLPKRLLHHRSFLVDSWKRQREFDSTTKHHLLVFERQRRNICSIQLQFLPRSSKSVGVSTWQPESHHRVVFLQPTPSLEGVLNSRRINFLVSVFWNCLSKALMFFICTIGETSRALFRQQIRRPFKNKPDSHHRMSQHQLLPL